MYMYISNQYIYISDQYQILHRFNDVCLSFCNKRSPSRKNEDIVIKYSGNIDNSSTKAATENGPNPLNDKLIG